MKTEYWVLLHGKSPVGAYLLKAPGKIGGATGTEDIDGIMHPLIVATDLDSSKLSGFVWMRHLQDPGMPDDQPRELVVPAGTILLVVPHIRSASQPREEQKMPPLALH